MDKLSIKQWAEEDRPREKLLLKGVSALSDSELLAILIGSGNSDESAVALSKRILLSVNNNLNNLGKLDVRDLVKSFKGIGEAKGVSIVAALELGRRRKTTEIEEKPQITSSKHAYNELLPLLADLNREEIWALLLDRSNKVVKKMQVSRGGISTTVMDVRVILREALNVYASGIVLGHNHPSGNCKPSPQDMTITRKLKDAAQLMDISLIDHLIVSDEGYYSFGDAGTL